MIVPYEIAVKLKQLGFSKECLYWYNENGTLECPIEQGYTEYYYEVDSFLNDWNNPKIDRDLYGSYPPKVSFSAPTVSEALQDIRERYNIESGCIPLSNDTTLYTYLFRIKKENGFYVKECERDKWALSYPEAELSLLKQVVEYLIEKK